jgi:hypothetical protein
VADEQQDPDHEPYESLLYGPLEAERKRQAQAATQPRKPDYGRVMKPIERVSKTPELVNDLGESSQ